MSPTATASWPSTSPACSTARSSSRSRSHGYEVDKDGFGYRGKALEITEGGSAEIVIRRLNIARRLYRVTGAGIYRDSVLTGDPVPIREPLLNGQVFGQDSVVNAVYQGKIHWFWGDTNRPDYPLGNFHVPGATSDLPGQGGLEPEVGVNLSYFVDDKGFARPTAPMPGEGPTWISGLVVLKDRQARERMFAVYAKIRKMLEVYERGLAEFNPQTQRFEKVAQFPEAAAYAGEYPDGHPFLSSGPWRRVYLLCQPVSPGPRAGRPRSAQEDRVLRGLYVPASRAPGWRSSSSTAVPTAACATAGRRTRQLVRQDQQTKLIVVPADQARGGAVEPARHRLRQGRGGAWRLGLLERLPQALGDDRRGVVRQHVVSWARSGTPRPIRRWAPGSTPARS